MDLLFRDADVLDGTGAPVRRSHVGVEGDRIVAVTTNEPGPAARTIDATGLALAPGFIDTHGHSDLSPFVEPTMDSAIRQGITTIVVGNCGTSAWPDAGRADAAEVVAPGSATDALAGALTLGRGPTFTPACADRFGRAFAAMRGQRLREYLGEAVGAVGAVVTDILVDVGFELGQVRHGRLLMIVWL